MLCCRAVSRRNARGDLNAFEAELLRILGEELERFESGEWRLDATLYSRTGYRMAKKRGKTLPSPVPGKSNLDRGFRQRFRRVVDGLIKKGLIERRPIGGPLYPNQEGYMRHAAKARDIFLTEAGRARSAELRKARARPAATEATQARRSQRPAMEIVVTQGPSRAAAPAPRPDRGEYDYDIVITLPE
jgi:hypothetical protein